MTKRVRMRTRRRCHTRSLNCHCEEHPLIPSSSRDVAISMRLNTRRRRDCHATLAMTNRERMRTRRRCHTRSLNCHCEEHPLIPSSSRDVAISMRLNTRRRTAVATATGLPRYARNDKSGTQGDVPAVSHSTPADAGKRRVSVSRRLPPPVPFGLAIRAGSGRCGMLRPGPASRECRRRAGCRPGLQRRGQDRSPSRRS